MAISATRQGDWTHAIDLDTIHWEPGGYNTARDKRLAVEMVRQAAEAGTWIIEGVYGWLAQEAASRATRLDLARQGRQ